jgi:hypothetical protein
LKLDEARMDTTWISGGLPTAAVGAVAAFSTAFAGSAHCALMCGPLACAATQAGGPGGRTQVRAAAWAWQFGRLGSYAGVGGVLGAVGGAATTAMSGSASRVLPWVMAGGLALSALRVGARVRPLPGLAQIPRRAARMGARFSPVARAGLLAAATPFLPCGLLYGGFLMAASAGSIAGGALVMLAFGLAGVPSLGLMQALLPRGAARLSTHPRLALALRRGVPLLAAAVLVWRALATGGPAAGAPPHCH